MTIDDMKIKTIDSFKDEYFFLSNFHDSEFVHEGITYKSNEHFYQAMKSLDRNDRIRIANLQFAGQTKKEGRKLQIRSDWEYVKIDVMRQGLKLKFDLQTHPDLCRQLIETFPNMLVEGNYWGDTFWGIYNGQGLNWLGLLLMERREELLEELSK
jgi:ribA/ribD-fused uncharacterized protein